MPALPEIRLVAQLDAVLPQTQCTRCGYPDCLSYARAMVVDQAPINRCPPGGAAGIEKLSALTGRPAEALDPSCGSEGPKLLASIDEAWCIGCTLCIKACPVDCIVGANKHMHTVVASQCTGCELCVPACPVDCIRMEPCPQMQGALQASPSDAADLARQRYQRRTQRLATQADSQAQRLVSKAEHKLAHLADLTHDEGADALQRKRAVIEAALARARSR